MLLGPPMTPTNVVGYFMIIGIILDFKVIIMGILLVKLELFYNIFTMVEKIFEF